MKKLKVTKERFEKSRYFQKKYGKLKYVSESGNIYKTAKGNVIQFVNEAREYVDDSSIDLDSVEEFIIFEDPEIFKKIASVQTQQGKELQEEVKDGEVKPQEVSNATAIAATAGAVGQIGSAAISTVGNIATSKAALGLAAAAGYKKVLDAAGEVGAEAGGKVGDAIAQTYYANQNALLDDMIRQAAAKNAQYAKDFSAYCTKSNLGNLSNLVISKDRAIQLDKRAMYIGNQLLTGGQITGSNGKTLSPEEGIKWLSENGYQINKDGIVNRTQNWIGNAASGAAGAGAATGAAAGGGGGWMFGLSAATVGWIVAGVAAAAIITPYIYDKVRACAKTWLADIIAEVKFKADGKNYRCFYDLKDNKWVLTYADIKWTSYLDNKLDKETTDEFFASQFFKNFLDKCRQTFALLFSTSKNEVVFKTLPEIKDAPKELKDILEKIYDNKGAITKNLFTGRHD